MHRVQRAGGGAADEDEHRPAPLVQPAHDEALALELVGQLDRSRRLQRLKLGRASDRREDLAGPRRARGRDLEAAARHPRRVFRQLRRGAALQRIVAGHAHLHRLLDGLHRFHLAATVSSHGGHRIRL